MTAKAAQKIRVPVDEHKEEFEWLFSVLEDAGRANRSEVHTHEVLEDDVPDEYLDAD